MRLFLAGAETKGYFKTGIAGGTGNLLFSNFHRQDIDIQKLKKHNQNIIMDSGLFTMMFGAGKGQTFTEKDLHIYMQKYIQDMKDMGWYGAIVEMDVHKVLGLEALERFRQYFEKHRDIERTIFVYHVEEGVEGLKRIAKKYPYIALSVPELRIVYGNRVKQSIQYFLSVIRKVDPTTKVHLLGCTSVDLLKIRGYYSADSSSRLSAGRYGDLSVFQNGKLQKIGRYGDYDINKLLASEGLKPISNKVYDNVSLFLARQYKNIQIYITTKYNQARNIGEF